MIIQICGDIVKFPFLHEQNFAKGQQYVPPPLHASLGRPEYTRKLRIRSRNIQFSVMCVSLRKAQLVIEK